ncbi:hypothetical protein EJB05_09086, partial [Eragrostis curvula]
MMRPTPAPLLPNKPDYMSLFAHKSRPSPPSTPTVAVDPCHGVHLFEVADYSHHRDLGARSFVRSATFHVGGCAWSIRFYPNGENFHLGNEGYVAVALELVTKDAAVTASCDLRLVDQQETTTTEAARYYSAVEAGYAAFDTRCVDAFARLCCANQFIRRSELEASTYLRDDRLVIECTLRVIRGNRPPPAEPEIDVPLSDMADHLGRLLKEGDGADVTFDVQGETFPAHRTLLAARSPVFKAELRGPMKEATADRIAVHEIRPEVFKALLHFVYTDSLLPVATDGNNKEEDNDDLQMTGDLLVAADRYAMDRLKLICERNLSRSLTVENVSTVLVLASRHNCSGLKDACSEFMMSNNRIMDDVARTEGYASLKRDHPHVMVDLFEKAVKLRKIAS